MKSKLIGLTMAACSVLGVAVATEATTAPSASAEGFCDAPKVSGATGSVRCAGPGQFATFQFHIYCLDGISGYKYELDSAWLNRGATARLTCGAPQRQTVYATSADFRF